MERKYKKSMLLLITLILVTTVVVFQGNDAAAVFAAIGTVALPWLLLGIGLALLFVSLEGFIIWYLLHSAERKVSLPSCIRWSFIGFFFSGITPSSTGGQPMQVYYMKQKGVPVSESTPVLMIVAVLYKLILVLVGIGIWLFQKDSLKMYFGSYLWLYYLGLLLNTTLVVFLVFIMVSPVLSRKILLGAENVLVTIRILKQSQERRAKLAGFVAEYQDVVYSFKHKKGKLLIAAMITLLQRCCPFLIMWVVYRGLGLTGTGILTIVILQAAVTIAVDLLPLPGAAGITELVSAAVFAGIFPGELLAAALCVSRGISFYIVMLLSGMLLLFRRQWLCGILGKRMLCALKRADGS